MYQSSVLLSLSQERKWLKCILTSASTDCGRRGSTRSSWTMRTCCDPETLRAWVLAVRTPPFPCETPHPTSSHEREQELDIMPLVSERPLCIPTLHSRPGAMNVADGFRAEDRDERGHVPRTALHVRVRKVKSLLGGSVEEWRLTVFSVFYVTYLFHQGSLSRRVLWLY